MGNCCRGTPTSDNERIEAKFNSPEKICLPPDNSPQSADNVGEESRMAQGSPQDASVVAEVEQLEHMADREGQKSECCTGSRQKCAEYCQQLCTHFCAFFGVVAIIIISPVFCSLKSAL